jgi:putative polyhydroxyalkanoic acid system protein
LSSRTRRTTQPSFVGRAARNEAPLGRQEARRRLDRGIGRLEGELGALLSGLDHHWQGDTLNFTASAMWQRITGRIEMLDDAVRVEIELPWVMQFLRDTITKRVRGRGVALLEKPPGEA